MSSREHGAKNDEGREDREDHPGWDMTKILADWAYDPAQTVRRIQAEGGREVIQVRLPLGLEQYEIEGRPDGSRPMGHESWLHYYWRKAKRRAVDGRELALSEEDFGRLHQEGLLYYHRYLLFFQIQDYRHCARDTRRNLKLLEFAGRHARREDAESLEQYRPYILRMNYMARALFRLKDQQDIRGALRLLYAGLKALERLEPLPGNQVFAFEKSRSTKSIEDLIQQLEAHVPKHVALQNELLRAVREENYERAAALRDEIAELRRHARKEG